MTDYSQKPNIEIGHEPYFITANTLGYLELQNRISELLEGAESQVELNCGDEDISGYLVLDESEADEGTSENGSSDAVVVIIFLVVLLFFFFAGVWSVLQWLYGVAS